MKRISAVIATAMTAAVLAGTPALAASHRAKSHTIGSCRAQGDFAICVASGTAKKPRAITVHVSASPKQSVDVAWTLVCTKGLGAGSKSGQFSAGTPVSRKVPHPYARPDSCTVSADAQLSGSGSLHVWLTYSP